MDKTPAAFIMSPNYPHSFPAIGDCKYVISSSGNIRVNIFDFQTSSTDNTFTVSGKYINDSDVEFKIFGPYVTFLDTMPLYFINNVTISFNLVANTDDENCLYGYDECQRFFLILQPYLSATEQTHTCFNDNKPHDMSSKTPVSFGTTEYGSGLYGNNQDCTFIATSPPEGHRITAEIYYESESCCDFLKFTGLTDPDDWRYRGEAIQALIFAEKSNLTLNFKTDGLGKAVGFSGTFATQDCNCASGTIKLDENNTIQYIHTPPLDNGTSTYCPRMTCFWVVEFPQNKILKIIPIMLSLRREKIEGDDISEWENVIHISDEQRGVIQSITSHTANKTLELPFTGIVNISFSSEDDIYVDVSERKMGFNISLTLVDIVDHIVENETISKAKPYIAIDFKSKPGPPTCFLKTIQTDPGNTIQLFVFEMLTTEYIDIFDGKDINASLYNTTSLQTSNFEGNIIPISSTGPFLTIRVCSNEGGINFKALASIYGNDNYTKLCSKNFVFNLKEDGVDQDITLNAPNTISCQLILHGAFNDTTSPWNAITLKNLDKNGESRVSIYKGLYSDDKFLLASTLPYPDYIYAEYVSLFYTQNSAPIIQFTVGSNAIGDYLQKIGTNGYQGLIMTSDFLSNSSNTSLKQQFVLGNAPESNVKITVKYLAPINGSTVELTSYTHDSALNTTTLSVAPDQPSEFCASSVSVTYKPNGNGDSNGLYAQYTIGEPDGTTCTINSEKKSNGSCVMFKRIHILLTLSLVLIQGQISRPSGPCGPDSIPYSLTIDLNAQPTLSCQTPECFGHGHEHQDLDASYQDYEMSNELPKRRLKRHVERIADCSPEFLETVCTGNNEWTAGVKEVNNETHISLQMLCCRYDGLNNAMALKSIVMDPGDRYIGGVVNDKNGNMVGFDLVKEIRKNVTDDQRVQYIVEVYRMQCLPDPPEKRNKVDPYVEKQIDYLPDRVTRDSTSVNRGSEDLRYPSSSEVDDYDERYPRRRSYARKSYAKSYERGYRRRDLPVYYDRDHLIRRQPRPVYSRRRYYRPVVEEYDDEYEDLEPVPVVRRPKYYYYKRPKTKIYDDGQLWPVAYVAKPKPRVYAEENSNYIEPIAVEAISVQTDDVYNRQVPATLPPALPIQQQQQVHQFQQQQSLQSQATPSLSPINEVQPYVAPQTLPPPPPALPAIPPPSTSLQNDPGCTNLGNAVANGVQTYSCGGGGGEGCSGCSGGSTSGGGNICDLCGPGNGAGSQPQIISQGSQYSNAYPQSSYSNYAGGGTGMNSAFSSLQCFSGDMLVQTPTGHKRMDELELGDMVLSIEEAFITYSPVVMFLHKKSEEKAVYRQFVTDEGKTLKLTDYHLIYATDCKPNERLRLTHAKDVQLGQCIYVVESEHGAILKSNKVVEISKVEETGIYAPLTSTGDIIVNNVLASCHSNMAVQTLQQTFFSWWRSVHGIITKWLGPSYMDSSFKTGDLPYGVEYLTTVMDIIVPKSLIR
uniref:Uncharacterized protein n=1 Tax=Acrobeloides nanus TaxID=290746 RepID=A0A914CPS4_9BILA